MLALDDYLSTTYAPDREYVDGALVERHGGSVDTAVCSF